MYFIMLFMAALFVFFILSSNWPVKLYHGRLIEKIGREFQIKVVKSGRLFADFRPEVQTTYKGKELHIRFLERSMDSLKAGNSGLEFRVKHPSGLVLEFYRHHFQKREWGHFKRWVTGDRLIDSQWFILTPHPEAATEFWKRLRLIPFLNNSEIEQIMFNDQEIIVRIRRFQSAARVKELIDQFLFSLESSQSLTPEFVPSIDNHLS